MANICAAPAPSGSGKLPNKPRNGKVTYVPSTGGSPRPAGGQMQPR